LRTEQKVEEEKLKGAYWKKHQYATLHDFLANSPFRQGRVVFFTRKPLVKNLHPTLDKTTKSNVFYGLTLPKTGGGEKHG